MGSERKFVLILFMVLSLVIIRYKVSEIKID